MDRFLKVVRLKKTPKKNNRKILNFSARLRNGIMLLFLLQAFNNTEMLLLICWIQTVKKKKIQIFKKISIALIVFVCTCIGYVKERLFRTSCVNQHGNFVKDLSVIHSDLSQVIIIDNSPIAYSINPGMFFFWFFRF